MKILMLTEGLGSGGARRQVCTLADEFKRRGDGFIERIAVAIDEWAADAERRRLDGLVSRRIAREKYAIQLAVRGHRARCESLLK